MPSRPSTPAGISDTSSDPGSLSDLESGWTDLSSLSNRSASGGRHSPVATSDGGDSVDARSAIDMYDGGPHDAWEGLTPEASELNVREDAHAVESPTTAHPVHSLSSQQSISELALEDWVSEALGSSLLSDNEASSTPHVSIRGSQALRLAFPDPLSNSEDNLLPSHILRRHQVQPTEVTSEVEADRSGDTQTLSSLASSFTRTLPSDLSSSLIDDDASGQDKSNGNYEMPSLDIPPSTPVSYALSVILLGHPPLPHFKSEMVSTLMDMVAFVVKGTPDIPQGSDSMRIYEVPIHPHNRETSDAQLEAPPTHRIHISDRTSGSSSSMSFDALDCPTVALVFIQPPLSTPTLPILPLNTRYLPLLLPSVSDGFASSLLDLSPSVLFDHSVPNISTPDHGSRKSFALQQCVELNILEKRLDGARDVLGVDEFIALPAQHMSTALAELIFSEVDKSEESSDKESAPGPEKTGPTELQNRFSAFHKQVVIISAFLALLFGSTVLLRGTFSSTTVSSPQVTIYTQSQKFWPFFNHFLNAVPSAVPTTAPPRSRASVPESLKSLAASVFRPESTDAHEKNVAGPSTGPGTGSDKEKDADRPGLVIRAGDEHSSVRVASLDPAVRPLTLDAPSSKSLPTLPPARSGASKGKGKERTVEIFPVSPNSFPDSFNALSTRMSYALSPLFEAAKHDLQELQEAIDALLRALLQLQEIASQGIGDVVQAFSQQAEQNVQCLASKVYNVASYRHARAKYNARKVRDVGERYVSAARQMLGAGFERARGNAKEVLNEGHAMGRIASRARRQLREESRKLRRQAREHRKSARKDARMKRAECRQKKARGAECFFHSVVAYVA